MPKSDPIQAYLLAARKFLADPGTVVIYMDAGNRLVAILERPVGPGVVLRIKLGDNRINSHNAPKEKS
jgi:hypothetical protein